MCHLFILKHWLLLIAACLSKHLRRWRSKIHFIIYILCNCTGLRKTLIAGAATPLLTLFAVLAVPAPVSLLFSCLLVCSHCRRGDARAMLFAGHWGSSRAALGSQTRNVSPVPVRGYRGCNKSCSKMVSVIRTCHLNWVAVRWQLLGKILLEEGSGGDAQAGAQRGLGHGWERTSGCSTNDDCKGWQLHWDNSQGRPSHTNKLLFSTTSLYKYI